MTPKDAAAIMIGTIASPSRPSVRFTALPAPTMTKQENGTKNQPRLMMNSLAKGKVSDDENGAWPLCMITQAAMPAMTNSSASRALPEKPRCDCFVTLR